MSGGHYEYNQWTMSGLVNDIWNDYHKLKLTGEYSEATLARMNEATRTLSRAAKMVHQLDLLLSGDTDENDMADNWPRRIL